ncbi:MAG: hypothetical protein K5985_00805 [Lachnospiraceae bacterium]|nr:hypothetical protein [Lachnospiraceae bacterium]
MEDNNMQEDFFEETLESGMEKEGSDTEISREKSKLPDSELETVSGGYRECDRGAYYTVGDCYGGYLALRPQPVWDQYHEIARLYPGYEVFTYGATTNGTGLNGVPCTYIYVEWNGNWGWANYAFLQ